MQKKTLLTLCGISITGILIGGVVFGALTNSTTKVVVPSKTISAGETFSKDNLKIVDMPNKAIKADITYTSIEKVVGKVAVSDICADELITKTRVANSEEEGYIANMNDKSDFALQITFDSSYLVEGIGIGDYVSIIASVQETEGSNVSTGKVGSSYKVLGISKDEDGNITNITIEVPATEVSKISHSVINTSFVVSFVSKEQGQIKVPGITQSDLFSELNSAQ